MLHVRLPAALALTVLLTLTAGSFENGFVTHAAQITQVAAGAQHTCALTAGGEVRCWGRNDYGQLGDGTTTDSAVPVKVVGLGSAAAAIAAGSDHTCAITAAGGLKCWGRNYVGQVGNGTTNSAPIPTEVVGLTSGVAAVDAAFSHTCAVTVAGDAKCWGYNDRGQLGDGSTTTSITPVDVAGLTGIAADVSLGDRHTCALTTAGAAMCWGYNHQGELGDGTTVDSLTPVGVSGLASGVAQVSSALTHTCALLSNGGLKCWGFNEGGQMGNGSYGLIDMSATPVDVSGLTSGVAAVDAGDGHTCALTTAGGAKCWGWNGWGQVGLPIGAITDIYPTPQDVTGLSAGVSSVSAGAAHSCAVTSAGAVKCWGWNSHGQLGDGGATDSGTPVDMDFDRDGCTDAQELGPDQTQGGQRNPKNFWDFFDTPNTSNVRDKVIAIDDVLRVNNRFGAVGDPTIDPLSPPPPQPAYHTAFDRTPAAPGGDLWDLQGPDGSISIQDILLVVNTQFGHTCV